MRFPSKKSFVRASLLFVFALPNLAYAEETPEEMKAREQKEAAALSAKYLDLEAAKTAFGTEFSIEDRDGVFTLFGGTSVACRSAFDIKSDPVKGEFRIYYDGSNADCLEFDKAMAEKLKPTFVSLSGGDKSEDGKMKPTGTFKVVNLAVPKKNSSKGIVDLYELKDGDKSLSHVSEAEAKKKKLQAETDKKALQTDTDITLVTKCIRGLKELDVGDDALTRLLALPEAMKSEIAKAKGDDWMSESEKAIREKKFKACKVQFARAKEDSIADAKCDDRLKKIAGEDDSYVAKIKTLYLDLIGRYMRDATNGTKSIDESYDAAVAAVDKLRDEGYKLSEDDLKDVDAAERNFNLHFLRLAATKGANSEEFKSIQGKMLDYMLADDANECLVTETGAINPAQARNSKCQAKQWLSQQLGQQVIAANGNQALIDKKAAELQLAAKEADDLAACSALPATATDVQKKACTDLQARVDARNSAAANGSLNTAANGFGQVVNTTATTTLPAKESTGSGLLESGYKAPTTNTSVITPKENVTVNTVPQGNRRLTR